MHATRNTLIAILLLYAPFAFSQDEESDKQRARDRAAYFLDLTSKVAREVCGNHIKNYGASFDAAYPAWLQANKDRIERGRDETIYLLRRNGSIEAYEADAIAAFGEQFASLPKDRRKTRCQGILNAFGAGE